MNLLNASSKVITDGQDVYRTSKRLSCASTESEQLCPCSPWDDPTDFLLFLFFKSQLGSCFLWDPTPHPHGFLYLSNLYHRTASTDSWLVQIPKLTLWYKSMRKMAFSPHWAPNWHNAWYYNSWSKIFHMSVASMMFQRWILTTKTIEI